MIYLRIILAIVQSVTYMMFFGFVHHYFEAKRSKKYFFLYGVFVYALGALSYYTIKVPHIPAFITILLLLLVARWHSEISIIQAYVISLVFFSVFYNVRGIVVSLGSLITSLDIAEIFANPLYHDVMYIVTFLITMLLFYVTNDTFLSKKDIKALLRNEKQLEFLAIYQTVLLLFTMIVNDGRYEDFRVFWYVIVYAANNITVLFLLPLRLMNSADVSRMIEDLMYTSQIEDQLERQLSHYHYEKKREEEMVRFRHDYKNIISVMETLIENDNFDEMKNLLQSMKKNTEMMVTKEHQFSNNKIVDAILLDCYHLAGNAGARFEAKVYIPQNTSCSEFELVRIFSNLTRNAIEAVKNNPDQENYIRIISVKDALQNRVLITVENTYNGKVRIHNNRIATKKEDTFYHGNGLAIVEEILDENGELLVIDFDEQVFKVRFSLKAQSGE